MRYRHTRIAAGIIVAVTLACSSGCTSLRPLEPGGTVYPPGNHLRYDIVPAHAHVIGIPVTGLRGNPSKLRVTIRDQYNPPVVIDSQLDHTTKDGYLVYWLDRSLLSERRASLGITNAPAQIEIAIEDMRDPAEGFILTWFRWWGRSDSQSYVIIGR